MNGGHVVVAYFARPVRRTWRADMLPAGAPDTTTTVAWRFDPKTRSVRAFTETCGSVEGCRNALWNG